MSCKEQNPCDKGCLDFIQAKCITYSDVDTTFLQIPNGMILDDIIQGLDNYLANLQAIVDGFESQTLSYDPDTYELSISEGNTVVLTPPPTPNLQQVTDVGNITDNSVFITGINSLPASGSGLWLASSPTNSFIGAFDFDNPGVDLDLQITAGEFSINGTTSGGSSTIGADNISVLGPTSISLISSGTVDIEVPGTGANVWFRDNTNTGARVRGGNAVNNDEFVTLQQLNSSIPTVNNIYNSDGTLTADRTVSGDSHDIAFIGVSDFRVQAAAFATFILNDTTFQLTDGINGNLIGQGGNTTLSTTGNLILWAATNGSSGKSVAIQVGSTAVPLRLTDISNGIAGTFTGRVIGEPAVNSNEFITLSQLPSGDNIYNSDGTLTGNRLVNGNTGTLEFHNLEMFRASGGVSGTQTIMELGALTSHITRGTEVLSFFDNGISLESQFVSGQILLNAPNVQVTQLFNDGLTPNRFLTTDAAGNMILDAVAFVNGTGISYDALTATITNTAPDQTVSLSNGTGISATGTYPNFTIANTAPDQVVTISNGTGISVTGTYPNFTVTNTAPFTGSFINNGTSPQTANFNITGNGTIGGDLAVTGTVTASGGGFNSSRLLKEDIREFTKSALDILSRVPIIQFKYKTNKNNTIGFIADEAPDEVLIDGQEAMDIYSTIGLLIKGIQELNDRINGLGSSRK